MAISVCTSRSARAGIIHSSVAQGRGGLSHAWITGAASKALKTKVWLLVDDFNYESNIPAAGSY